MKRKNNKLLMLLKWVLQYFKGALMTEKYILMKHLNLDMNITLIRYDKYKSVDAGEYLVKTKTKMGRGNLLKARVSKVLNQKTEQFENRVDVTNQIVTHISTEPIKPSDK